jgi:hypothetical protein
VSKAVRLSIFIFFLSSYLLTWGGHTYSPDEETLYYVTEGIVQRGSFVMPSRNEAPVSMTPHGIDGKPYAPTSLGQSVIAIPLFVLGDFAAQAFPARFHDYIIRFFVCLLNPVVSACTGVLLFAFATQLGYSRRVALTLALVYGFATMAWVYAKTFFTEPLATLCLILAFYGLYCYKRDGTCQGLFLAGAATGYAMLTRIHTVIALPAIAFYLAMCLATQLGSLPRQPRAWLTPVAAWAAPLVVAVAIISDYNFIRFGNPLQTGYTPEGVTTGLSLLLNPIYDGLYGLLGSPGKSVFLFTPPLLLALLAFMSFFREHAAEGVAFALLIIAHLLFYAPLPFWGSASSWGPRYMFCIIPFALMPAASFLSNLTVDRFWLKRSLAALLVAAGVFVQSMGVLINFSAYVNIRPPTQSQRYFDPFYSPILGHWRLLVERSRTWSQVAFGGLEGIYLVRGFYAPEEVAAGKSFPRFTGERASLKIVAAPDQHLALGWTVSDFRPSNLPRAQVTFRVNGQAVQPELVGTQTHGTYILVFPPPHPQAFCVEVEADTWNPAALGVEPRRDDLGLYVMDIGALSGDTLLPLYDDLSIPPMPSTPAERWGWFYYPGYAHFDLWFWYLYFSGMSTAQVATLTLPLLSLATIGLLASACFLRREWTR